MILRLVLVLALVASSCSDSGAAVPVGDFLEPVDFDGSAAAPPAPEVGDGPLDSRTKGELDALVQSIRAQGFDAEALLGATESGDARIAWMIADLLRFFQTGGTYGHLVAAFEDVTGTRLDAPRGLAFKPAMDLLIGWNLPAWDGYPEMKRDIYTILEPDWQPFFDENISIDWRLVTWGGVLIDDRPLGHSGSCDRGCIPALDDPPTEAADDVTWYADSDVIFGIVVGGDALALPKNQMEVHEMVNLTLGGTRLGIPYCTLCGSAQAYRTAEVPDEFEPLVLRTSGLLSRSNKVMYDLNTNSVIDTFTGVARSGPLARADVDLSQVTVVASTWGEWKEAHPDTRILARDGGIGRTYERNPLGDRDADGPIFPVGPVDPRLPTQEKVLGVLSPDGTYLAFPVDAVVPVLEAGGKVGYDEIELVLDGDGLRVAGPDGGIPAHESFWFAWSQFHPQTLVWSPADSDQG